MEDAFVEFFDVVGSLVAAQRIHVTICHLGLGMYTLDLSRRILAELAPPSYRTSVILVTMPEEVRDAVRELIAEYPSRAQAVQTIEEFDSHCSVVLLPADKPRFNFDDVYALSYQGAQVLVGHFGASCSPGSYECRYLRSVWEDAVGDASDCRQHFCAAVIPTAGLRDPQLAEIDCRALVGDGAPASTISQWQQDWFVYQNFVRGTRLDTSMRHAVNDSDQGVFVDIGAFHPIQLSNTFFFEHCLGWRGVCVEPNPSLRPYFGAYRSRCQLFQNCVWSRPRSVTMSFQKDPIEAYIQEEHGTAGSGAANSTGGAVPIRGDGPRPSFTAECRTLQDILSAAGLRKPMRIDYMSVDAEAAEVEIFRDFPFDEFDISVISVEVQATNYYELDVVFANAGYAKVGVLGGDHVFGQLKRKLVPPKGLFAWQRALAKDFHAYAPAQTATFGG